MAMDDLKLERGDKKKIAAFFIGGTIASEYDSKTSKVSTSENSASKLLDLIKLDNIFVDIFEVSNIPSSHITLDMGIELAKKVDRELAKRDVSGAIVVQGSDTLEEISYLLNLLIESDKPVVFTGSMKSLKELYSDSLGNLHGAITLAASEEARNHGVMVFFNQEIHSAEFATKDNANKISAFKSLNTGKMGEIINNKINFYYKPLEKKKFKIYKISNNVELISSYCGMSDLILRSCIEKEVEGIIIEGLGAGNLPPALIPSIKEAIAKGIHIVMVTRCNSGYASPDYDYLGGGANLEKMGLIFAGNLSAYKARIKLSVLIEVNNDYDFIKENFFI